MCKYIIIYYHPTFKESIFYFTSEQEAIDFAIRWSTTWKWKTEDLSNKESLTVVFN